MIINLSESKPNDTVFEIKPNNECAKVLTAAFLVLEDLEIEKLDMGNNRLTRKLTQREDMRFTSDKGSSQYYCALLTYAKYLSLMNVSNALESLVEKVRLTESKLKNLDSVPLEHYYKACYCMMQIEADMGNIHGVGKWRSLILEKTETNDTTLKASIEVIVATAMSGQTEQAQAFANILVPTLPSHMATESKKRIQRALASAYINEGDGVRALGLIKDLKLTIEEKQELFQPLLETRQDKIESAILKGTYPEAYKLANQFDRTYPFCQKRASLFLIQNILKSNCIKPIAILNNLAKPKNTTRYCYYGAYILCELMNQPKTSFDDLIEIVESCGQPKENITTLKSLFKSLKQKKSKVETLQYQIRAESVKSLFRVNITEIIERCKTYQKKAINLKLIKYLAVKGFIKDEELKKYLKPHTNAVTADLSLIEIGAARKETQKIFEVFRQNLKLI